MTDTTHTPGPWHVDDFILDAIDVDSPSGRIALIDCENDAVSHDQVMANAHLIAAAPELLAILEEISSNAVWASYPDAFWKVKEASMVRVRAAITKAKGE